MTSTVMRSESNVRGHYFKMSKRSVKLDARKYSFSNKVVNQWNALHEEIIDCKTVSGYKKKLEHHLTVIFGTAWRGLGRAAACPRPFSLYTNVSAHPSTASVPITILLYNDPLLGGCNVPSKGLTDEVRRPHKVAADLEVVG